MQRVCATTVHSILLIQEPPANGHTDVVGELISAGADLGALVGGQHSRKS